MTHTPKSEGTRPFFCSGCAASLEIPIDFQFNSPADAPQCPSCSVEIGTGQLLALSSAEAKPAAVRMSILCTAFHVLRKVPGVDPWDPVRLCEQHDRAGSGMRWAIAFVLDVWNSTEGSREMRLERYGIPAFDFVNAIHVWDAQNRAAFLGFAGRPWGT